MRLRAFQTTCNIVLAALAISTLVACGGAPVKPSVEIGVIDYPAGEVIENMTNGKSFAGINSIPKATSANVTRAVITGGRRVPLANYDHAIAFTPDWWDVEVQYVHSLEQYITNHCGPGQAH